MSLSFHGLCAVSTHGIKKEWTTGDWCKYIIVVTTVDNFGKPILFDVLFSVRATKAQEFVNRIEPGVVIDIRHGEFTYNRQESEEQRGFPSLGVLYGPNSCRITKLRRLDDNGT